MRGQPKQRSKGSWTIILDVGRDPATGKRKQQWVTVRGTKKEAEKKLTELIHEVDRGAYIKPTKVTVEDFLQRWLQDSATNRAAAPGRESPATTSTASSLAIPKGTTKSQVNSMLDAQRNPCKRRAHW